MEIFDFEKTRCLFLGSISEVLEFGDPPTISELLLTNNLSHIGEMDKKAVWDQTFRDRFLSDSANFSIPLFEKLLQLSLDSAVALVCSPTLPVILLTDAFEILSLEKCEEIFYMVEMKVSIWKQELFFNQCKNYLLRLCNDLLRRLSRSQNTVFCGRILLFLAKFFPFSERSGLNVVSEFNLDNLTTFGAKDESYASEISSNSEKHKDEMEVEESLSSDYNLYKKFWSLQDFFRNPNQCYTKIPWKTFCLHTNDVLSAFSTIKLDERRNRSKWDEADTSLNVDVNETIINGGNVQQYFAKYLTSQNLLELQLGDSNFRRYILLQFLIMFQYLDSPVKFKQETQKLSEEQTTWVYEAIDQVYRLLKDTPPDGASFVQSIRHILKREELWSHWKNEGCPEFQPNIVPTSDNNIKDTLNGGQKSNLVGKTRRIKRSLGDQIREASKRNRCIIGNAEMNRLWNLCPDNMAACRSKDRDFLPTLENYFEEAIEQLDPSVESQYKRVSEANFGWRALRLLARRSLHFFTHGNTPITRLPDYLETHVRKLAKDMQQSANALPNLKQDTVDDAGDVEQMEPEADPVSNTSEMEGVPEETNGKTDEMEEEENTEKKPVLCSMDQLTRLAKQIGTNWKLLAPKLGFRPDEVEFFESETKEVEFQAKKMFEIWLETEADATPENLLYTLEGLGMLDSAQATTADISMLPNNVVSFMKKMVKNSDTDQQDNPMASKNKLTRLKQTLTIGFQQAQDSVAKFSPKNINVLVGDNLSLQLNSKEINNEVANIASIENTCNYNPTNPESALLNVIAGTKLSSGPPNRLTSCRVCVRGLLNGNSDVSYRMCSQCNLKVCEDCASYSDTDNDIEKTFWRCSVCRRRNQGNTSTMFLGTAVTNVAAQQPSLSISTDDYNKRSREHSTQISPGSAPVSRRARRSTSGENGIFTDSKYIKNSESMLNVESYKSVNGKSMEQIYIKNRKGKVKITHERTTNWLKRPNEKVRSLSACESSPEEITETQKHHEREVGISRKSASDIYFSESPSRHSSCRRSFQKETRDPNIYLSADDAHIFRLNEQRRSSSESSDASEASGTTDKQLRTSGEEIKDVECCGSLLPPSTRRRLSFRSNRSTCHFYDINDTESYDHDEKYVVPIITTSPTTTIDGITRSSPHSFSDTSQLSNELVTTISATRTLHRPHSPPGSIMYAGVNDDHLVLNRMITTQLSDPHQSHNVSHSPRLSMSACSIRSDRTSIDREAIRIVIDDVDCPLSCQAASKKPLDKTTSTFTVCLLRDSNFIGHGITDGFGLSLICKKNVCVSRIDSNGPADRAGLLCGDIILSWDGVQLVGWNFEIDDIEEELQHSGDSIQIEVLRESFIEDLTAIPLHSKQPNAYEHQEESVMRPNKLKTSALILDVVSDSPTSPSPTRRRLPRAPTGFTKPNKDSLISYVYRVQLQFKCSFERNGNVCIVITVIEAEKSHEIEEISTENELVWINIILTLPSGASRNFVTDRIESSFGLRWNSFFTCSDLTAEEVSQSTFCLSLWSDYSQKGETKIADMNLDLQNITMDGRPIWFSLHQCETSIFSSRRLSKAISHDHENLLHICDLSRKNSELSIYNEAQSTTSSQQGNPSSPCLCLPRSRSAEICKLLLQPEASSWEMSGLSAPASLAPSRRGSSYNCDEELIEPLLISSSRRGSSVVFDENETINLDLNRKLSSSDAQNIHSSLLQQNKQLSQWRSQSFRTETKHSNQHFSQIFTSKGVSRIINSSTSEFGTGQILPGPKFLDRDESILRSKFESCGQIKLGLLLTKEQLEVEVIAGRNLSVSGNNGIQPDTYVKVKVCNAEHVLGKLKTRTMRQTCHPEFHQTLIFDTRNDKNAIIVIEIKHKDRNLTGKPICSSLALSPKPATSHFSSEQNPSTLGLVHIALNRLTLTTLTISWYRLIPSHIINSTNIYLKDVTHKI